MDVPRTPVNAFAQKRRMKIKFMLRLIAAIMSTQTYEDGESTRGYIGGRRDVICVRFENWLF